MDVDAGSTSFRRERCRISDGPVAAFAALIAFQKWEEWVNAGLAAWPIVSPFILGFSALTYALWNQVIVGLLVGCLAIWSAVATSDSGS